MDTPLNGRGTGRGICDGITEEVFGAYFGVTRGVAPTPLVAVVISLMTSAAVDRVTPLSRRRGLGAMGGRLMAMH